MEWGDIKSLDDLRALEAEETATKECNWLWTQNLGDILRTDFPKATPLIDGLLYRGDQALIFGKPGSGKTYCTQRLMLNLAGGSDIGHYRIPEPKKILYVDGEVAPESIKKRFQNMRQDTDTEKFWETAQRNLIYISRFICPSDMPNAMLTSLEDESNMQKLIETIKVNNIDVLVIDNIFTCFSFQDYSSPVEWITYVNPLLNFCRKEGITCWIVDHSSKNGQLFGTVSKQITLDLLIKIESEKAEFDDMDYDESIPDFTFTFSFEKARRLTNNQQQPVEFEMKGGNLLIKKDLKKLQLSLAKQFWEMGTSSRDIADIIKEQVSQLDPPTFKTICAWAKREGWERLNG